EHELRKKTGGHYPAPFAALRVIRKTHRMGMRAGLKVERYEFGRLAPKAISKNLIQLFFTSEALKRHPITQGEDHPPEIERAAVLGAGVMGGRIAWLFSNKSIPVVLRDLNWDVVPPIAFTRKLPSVNRFQHARSTTQCS
ncbi:MAG: 3-hydroxyacyl-CoA dehydrogenase NAD-binding domain-containing protein, partial [Spirochaetia bacterium]